MIAFRQTTNNQLHLAIFKGKWSKDDEVLIRVHSSCVTGDIFGSCRCDCGPQLHQSLRQINQLGDTVANTISEKVFMEIMKVRDKYSKS